MNIYKYGQINCSLRLRIRPRHLRDVSQRSTSTEILGFKSTTPIGIAPTAMHRMAHDDGEVASAKGEGFLLCSKNLLTSTTNSCWKTRYNIHT